MHPLVTQLADVSAWDKATAIGTLGGAGATLMAVLAAFIIGWRDRKASSDGQREALEAQRARDAREHELELLLGINKQLAKVATYTPGIDKQKEAWATLRGLLGALPHNPEYADLRDLTSDSAAMHRPLTLKNAQESTAGLIRKAAAR